MRSPLILAFMLVSIAAQELTGTDGDNGVEGTWKLFPDSSGDLKPSLVEIGEEIPPRINGRDDVKFYLYTRSAPSSLQLFVGDAALLNSSSFDPNLPTLMITHGYRATAGDSAVMELKDGYLKVKDCNAITVDWSGLASNILYWVVKNQTVDIGAYIAQMVDFMVSQGNLHLERLHLMGHSLGAHVMGQAGKHVQSGKVARITGIDPAGPLFTVEDTEGRLASGDAEFVDVIHACGGILSFKYAMGDADFFPNGGMAPMPGCGNDFGGACSHNRAWQYFAESIHSTEFKSLPCKSYEDFQAGLCNDMPKVSMGEPAPKSARGSFFLNTAPSPPYALG